MIREGSTVAYVGWSSRDGLGMDDTARVLAVSDIDHSHLLMTSGRREGDVVLVSNSDLVVTRQAVGYNDLDDSLSDGSLSFTSARTTFAREGPVGLLDALNAEGLLSCFDPIATEALGLVAARIRRDPAIRSVLAELDEEDREDVVQVAVSALLRDAFGGDDG